MFALHDTRDNFSAQPDSKLNDGVPRERCLLASGIGVVGPSEVDEGRPAPSVALPSGALSVPPDSEPDSKTNRDDCGDNDASDNNGVEARVIARFVVARGEVGGNVRGHFV